jgi:MFS superfamily sulfate permease-like transporter
LNLKPRIFQSPPRHAFTLLETAITLFIVALLVAAVFGILQSSLQLADNIKQEQEHELRVQKFVELCENIFNRLPADAVISIRPEKGFGTTSQLLEIANAVSPFDAATPGTITLSTTTAKDGSVALILSFEEIPLNFASTQKQNTTRPVQLALLQNLSTFHWRVFDPPTQQWVEKWNEKVTAADLLRSGQAMIAAQGQVPTLPPVVPEGQPPPTAAPTPTASTSAYPRPPMLELQLASYNADPRHWIFWVPASVSQ